MNEKILLLIPHYGKGGAERMFYHQCMFLKAYYNVIEVVFNSEIKPYFGETNNHMESLDVRAGRSIFGKALKFIRRCYQLRRLKLKYKPIATISHLEGSNFVNICSGGPGRAIIFLHGSKLALDPNRKGWIRLIENSLFIPFLYRMPSKIVSVSQGIKRELVQEFKLPEKKIIVIENGIDVGNITPLKEKPIPEIHKVIFNKPVVVFSGRLVHQKNLFLLVKIFSKIAKGETVNLLIIGEGEQKEGIKRTFKDLGIEVYDDSFPKECDQSSVFFLGWQENPFKYLRKSNIFLSTSAFEGYPLAICESIICGTPVFATDCPTGVNEIMRQGDFTTDYLLPSDDPVITDYGVLFPLAKKEEEISIIIEKVSKLLIRYLRQKIRIPYHPRKLFASSKELENYNKAILNLLKQRN